MSENQDRSLPKDLQEYLPLSQRPRVDETGVTGDWSTQLGDTLFALAAFVEGIDDSAWSGSREAAVVSDAIDQLEHPRRLFRRSPEPLVREDAVELLRELSARDGRRKVRELAVGVVAAFDVAARAGSAVEIDPVAAGAVALARATSAPLPIRTVLRSRRLKVTDGDWHVGTGSVVVDAPASAIVLFLYGRAPLPATT